MKALAMLHPTNPADDLRAEVSGLIEQTEVLGPWILVALYKRPDKTAGGVYLTDRVKDEDIYQGKVGLILKMGDMAFVPDENHQWPEKTPAVGDWIVFRISDAWPLIIGKQHCRLVQDVNVRMVIQSPDVVF